MAMSDYESYVSQKVGELGELEPPHRRDLTFIIDGFAWMMQYADRWETFTELAAAVGAVRRHYESIDQQYTRSRSSAQGMPKFNSPNDPLHAYVACSDNAMVCRHCGSHRDNHGSQGLHSRMADNLQRGGL